jgi:hypothetical protein
MLLRKRLSSRRDAPSISSQEKDLENGFVRHLDEHWEFQKIAVAVSGDGNVRPPHTRRPTPTTGITTRPREVFWLPTLSVLLLLILAYDWMIERVAGSIIAIVITSHAVPNVRRFTPRGQEGCSINGSACSQSVARHGRD